MPEYVVTWHGSEAKLVSEAAEEVVVVATVAGMLVTASEEVTSEVVISVAEGLALEGIAVGFAPFRHVHALEIFAGTLDQRAAYAGKV